MRHLVVLAFAAALAACGPVQEATMRVAPGVPEPEHCAPAGATVCRGGVPLVCSATGRFWSVLPPHPSGAPRVCPGPCVGGGDAGVAHCADGGVS